MESIKRLFWVLIRPSATFKYLREHPRSVASLILIAVAVILFTGVSTWTSMQTAIKEMPKGAPPGAPPPEEMIKQIQSPLMLILPVAGGLIEVVLILLIEAAVFYLLCSLLGGSGTFLNSLSLVGYSWVPLSLRYYAQFLYIILGTHKPILQPGLSALLPLKAGQPMSFLLVLLSNILSRIDIFTFWNLLLLILGLAVVYRISRRKSASIVISYWLATIVLGAGGMVLRAFVGI